MSLDELQATLSVVLTRVVAGTLEPGIGNAVSALARAMCAVEEKTVLADRLTDLEERLGIHRKGTA